MAEAAFRRNNAAAVMTGQRWTAVIAGPLVALIIAVSPAHADDHLATSADFIRSLAERAIEMLPAEEQTKEKRRDEFRSLFREGFAINGIARFVLGRYWRSAPEACRTEYMALFEDVTVNTWAERFSEYSGQEFTVQDAVNTPSADKDERSTTRSPLTPFGPRSPKSWSLTTTSTWGRDCWTAWKNFTQHSKNRSPHEQRRISTFRIHPVAHGAALFRQNHACLENRETPQDPGQTGRIARWR